MSKWEEVKTKLDQFSKEIIEAIRDKPDEITGLRNFDPVMSEFMMDRSRPVLTSFMNIGSHISFDVHKPISKKYVVERTLIACWDMQDLLEKHIERLEELLEDRDEKT